MYVPHTDPITRMEELGMENRHSDCQIKPIMNIRIPQAKTVVITENKMIFRLIWKTADAPSKPCNSEGKTVLSGGNNAGNSF
jgi:hypothetical protein